MIVTGSGTPRLTVAVVSNSLTVDTMLPVPLAVTSKLQPGRVSVPPAANVAGPVVASRYGNVVPVVVAVGPRNVADGVMVAVQTALAAVHSVTVKGPVVMFGGLALSEYDQLPATMLPANVD